jgi:hypothetical protein
VIERRDSDNLDQLHTAIQAFSNGLCTEASQAGMVAAALVVWTEITYSDDGTPAYETMYAATGDQTNPNVGLGLALNLLRTLERDIIGTGCEC